MVMDHDRQTASVTIKARVAGVAGGSPFASVEHTDSVAALRWVLRQFVQERTATTGHVWAADGPRDGVVLYRIEGQEVLIVGDAGMAAVAREYLPRHGWRVYPTPTPGTPLAELRAYVSVRTFNMLAREGFATTEQVAVLPDAALLAIRGFGGPTLETVRRALGTMSARHYPPGPSSEPARPRYR
jgi:hypothetical protein